MALSKQHEIHTRRKGRNVSLAIVLAGLIAIVFGLTVVKVSNLDFQQVTTEGQN